MLIETVTTYDCRRVTYATSTSVKTTTASSGGSEILLVGTQGTRFLGRVCIRGSERHQLSDAVSAVSISSPFLHIDIS